MTIDTWVRCKQKCTNAITKTRQKSCTTSANGTINESELEAETRKRCQAQEGMQRILNTRKHATGAKRRKTCNWCQTRENMHPVPSARKHASSAKRGKTRTGGKRAKTCNRCRTRENKRKPSYGWLWWILIRLVRVYYTISFIFN